ncbi:MAG: ABC transporter permease [Micromonosporaceae bacterium]
MSEIAERPPDVIGPPEKGPPPSGNALWNGFRRAAILFSQQREASVLIVVVALGTYFAISSSQFLTKDNVVNLSQITAPVAIIAIGEVLLLVCGEMDLSVGFIYMLTPFVMHYLADFYGVPAYLALLLSLGLGAAIGYINGFITVVLGVPSFITTLGTGFILWGITLTTSRAFPASIPSGATGIIQHWIGAYAWAEITWAVILVVIFQIVLTRTRWGLHTISVGGNMLGAREAGVNIAKIKIGNFVITGVAGSLVGLMEAFRTNTIDPSSGGYTPMFYAIAAAVIGGTALAGGSGTIIGAFLGAVLLAMLIDGFTILGVSANPITIFIGSAILIAMIGNVYLTRLRRAGRT